MAKEQLPDLRTRGEIQSYLSRVAGEVAEALESSKVAEELDRRDQLAGFRAKFEVPTIGQLLDEHERDASKAKVVTKGVWHMSLLPRPL